MADYVKKRTHIINHVKFTKAGPIARDLYDWGMLWSGQQETDGELPMEAVLASAWGAGGKKNIVVAAKLVEVGLWERTDAGFRVLRWSEQGNVTKAELEEKRKADREKKARLRSHKNPTNAPSDDDSASCPPGTPSGTPAGFLNSTSTSLSGSDSGRRDPEPDRSPTPRVFGRGATAERALEVFADAVTEVTGEPFVVGPAMFLRDDLCSLLNKRAPKGVTLDATLAWLGDTVQAWVRAVPELDDRKPSKLNDWLNAGKPDRRRRMRPQAIVQPGDNRAWKVPEEMP